MVLEAVWTWFSLERRGGVMGLSSWILGVAVLMGMGVGCAGFGRMGEGERKRGAERTMN